jgi:hypothetical protein
MLYDELHFHSMMPSGRFFHDTSTDILSLTCFPKVLVNPQDACLPQMKACMHTHVLAGEWIRDTSMVFGAP